MITNVPQKMELFEIIVCSYGKQNGLNYNAAVIAPKLLKTMSSGKVNPTQRFNYL